MTTIIILPEYIQKYIIRILSEYINNHNSKFRDYSSSPEFEVTLDKEKQVNKEIRSISIVSKLWFNTLSNNLYISNDFVSYRHAAINGNSNNNHYPNFNAINESDHYIAKRLLKQEQHQQQHQSTTVNKLLKDENVTELVLNIDQWDILISTQNIPVLLFKLINHTIKDRYVNLKRISVSYTLDYLVLGYIEFGNIRIRDCDYGFASLPSNIKEIGKLEFELRHGGAGQISEINEFFKNLNSVEKVLIQVVGGFNIKSLYEIISTCNIKCLSKTKFVWALVRSMEDLYYLLKLVPGLKELQSFWCIDGFNDHLNRMNGSSGESVCECYSRVINDTLLSHWDNVVQMLSENKSLKSLKMNQECEDIGYVPVDFDEDPNSNKLSNVFIDQLSSIFKSNKSISKLELEIKGGDQLVQKIKDIGNGTLKSFKYNGINLINKKK